MFFRLALKSLLSRKGSVILTILAISVSVFVMLGVEHIRQQTRENFSNTVSGVDLVVGARTGSLNLLLYSVFHIGNPTNNIQWHTYEKIASNPKVDWAVPMSLGDSHKGYRVLGTTTDYFTHFSYGAKRKLVFASGKPFDDVFDVVLGYEVAKRLNYQLGDKLVLAHGVAATSFSQHDDNPFRVSGILEPTGTPVDQTLHVSLQGIEAIHLNWQQGVNMNRAGRMPKPDQATLQALTPDNITAFMLGLKSRMAVFRVQRDINNYRAEPLMAILPGVALSELWQMMSVLEDTLRFVSALVLLAALMGLASMLIASIRERQPEMTLLRVIGASPWYLVLLIELETLLISLSACVLGVVSLFAILNGFEDMLASSFGLRISTDLLTLANPILLGLVVGLSLLVTAFAALMAVLRSRAGR